ncbi:MAG TPA: 3'(2'),5'-bisphosphate nucleotidase CysQ [Polyangiales bacterium]|nr:3'(2'),5'-bisphosphate nucleotidase CysQ [Polyangiales bacterium]
MLERELETAAVIAREAGQILLEIYATDFGVAYKGQGRGDPVTEADRRANAHIVSRLRDSFPDDAIIAEESDNRHAALDARRIWYVDPLDGTKEFVAKNGEFAVMIGLAVEKRATLGVVFQPSEDKLYRGVVGQGATLEHAGQARALHVSDRDLGPELTLVVSRSHRSKSISDLAAALHIQRELISGSVGLKVGLIAEQTADVYVHMSDKSSAWDTCGPEALLHAAGGRFCDLAGEPIVYGEADLRTRRGIFACNARAFDRVLPAVRKVAAQAGFLGASQ